MEMFLCNKGRSMSEIIEVMQRLIRDFQNPFLEQMFSQISHGKMLRSSMVFAIAGKSQQSIELCAIIELIQLASLLHDDVIDESTIRRGKKSINTSYGNKSAVMLGDALYAKAFYYLTFFDSLIAQSLSNAVCRLSSGEIYDVFLSQSFNPSKEKYDLMIEEKTASLIASSAECAAILVGLDDAEGYFHYGKCLGIAFQIIDDVLDITQPQEILGKPAMNDFREGKTTLPYLFLFEALDQEGRERLQGLCGKELNQDEKKWIKDHLEKYFCIEKSQQLAIEIANDSLKRLKNPYNPKLKEMIDAMIQRSF